MSPDKLMFQSQPVNSQTNRIQQDDPSLNGGQPLRRKPEGPQNIAHRTGVHREHLIPSLQYLVYRRGELGDAYTLLLGLM